MSKIIDEINEISRGCRLTHERLIEIIPIVSEKFNISEEDAFKKIQKTRLMPLTEDNTMICPNCGGETVSKLDGQRKYRYCSACEKREYVEFDNN